MYYYQYITDSGQKFVCLLIQYIWLIWEKISWKRRKQEGNDNTIPLSGDEDDQCLRDNNTRNTTKINDTFYSIYVQYNTRNKGYCASMAVERMNLNFKLFFDQHSS